MLNSVEVPEKAPAILVVRLGAFGDIVLTLPVLQPLKQRFPGRQIHWLTEAPYAAFLSCSPHIDQVWVADTKAWRTSAGSLKAILDLTRQLRRQRFEATFDFQGLMKSAALARLSGAGEVFGFSGGETRERAAALFYTDKVISTSQKRHQLEHHLDLVNPPLYQGQATGRIDLILPECDQTIVEASLSSLGISTPPVLLNPGGGWATKLWPEERFAELADRIEQELGLPTLLTPGPTEMSMAERIQARLKFAQTPFIKTTLTQLACLCTRSRLMVGGDTGPVHLAVSMGTPVVAILGPALAWRTGPFCPADIVVQHARPCPHPYRRTCADHFCMDIPVDHVFAAVVKRLGG